jgi:succinoglycan biosynthesis protein ExoM
MSELAAVASLLAAARSRSGASRVAIAVPTFRRPESLSVLLRALARQRLPESVVAEVVVLDNDDVPSAQATVERLRPAVPMMLHYRHVPQPGLSSVRNAALALVAEGYDLLAMIDDDEVPHEQWLAELVQVGEATGADAVVGPVPQVLPPDAPRWIRAGRFLDLPTYPDRATISNGYSGNCLLRGDAIATLCLAFDPALNFAGGEDLLFFRRLLAAGGRIVYAAAAVADEPVPPARLRASYLLTLNYRRGNTLSLIDRAVHADRRALAVRAAKASARVVLGLVLLVPLSLARGRCGAMHALSNIARGAGAFAGLAGYTYHAYRRDDAARG